MKIFKNNLLILISVLFLFTGCWRADIIINYIQSATTILVVCICFAGIIFVMWACLFKIKNQQAAVIVSTVICCIIMIPLIISMNYYVRKQVAITIINEEEGMIAKLRTENKVRTLERDKLENEIIMAKQSIEIENLNSKYMLLERARLQMQGFQQIAELALTQANFKYTMARKEPTTDIAKGRGINADYYFDEVLVVSNYDINAKFGIDLKEVKAVKTADNSVVVSGIVPKYIGSDKLLRDPLIKEIRRVDYKGGIWHRTRVLDDRTNVNLADIKEQQFDLELNKKLAEGMELGFMNDAIYQLAQNFIKIVLAPVYENIVFDKTARPDALPLMEFLSMELKENDAEKYKLLQINERITMDIFALDQSKPDEEINMIDIIE